MDANTLLALGRNSARTQGRTVEIALSNEAYVAEQRKGRKVVMSFGIVFSDLPVSCIRGLDSMLVCATPEDADEARRRVANLEDLYARGITK